MQALNIKQEDVYSKLKKLNEFKSAGEDRLYPRVLKESAEIISFPLKLIYEKSLKTGVVPEDWRCSYIAPIFKKGKRNQVNNYRPVSITSVVCKIFESIIRDHLMEYF